MLLDLQHCLAYTKPFPNGSDSEMKGGQLDLEHLSIFEDGEENKERPEYLTDDVVFKMIVMSLLCVTKLQATGRFGFVVCNSVDDDDDVFPRDMVCLRNISIPCIKEIMIIIVVIIIIIIIIISSLLSIAGLVLFYTLQTLCSILALKYL
jgi:hypothetical protein